MWCRQKQRGACWLDHPFELVFHRALLPWALERQGCCRAWRRYRWRLGSDLEEGYYLLEEVCLVLR